MTTKNSPQNQLEENLKYLKLPFMRDQHQTLAKRASQKKWSHLDYFEKLADALDEFNWTWPKDINRLQVQNLFRLQFVKNKSNIIFLGGVGLGKTHLASALGYSACLKGNTVLFATAIDVINTLSAAQAAGRMKQELKKYTRPALLIIDELGFLPIDKKGADLLFQVISLRYEQGALVITSNRAYKDWPEIFNNDSTLTSAILDRLLHHAETVVIEGKSYRMKDQIDA
jgi:DNA replication protein DnaC